MRLDKYLTDCFIGSRTDVKKIISKKKVKVNGVVQTKSDYTVSQEDIVEVDNQTIKYQAYYYFLLNKPKGYICATADKIHPTIMELFKDLNPLLVQKLFIVGRLDMDTEGMIIVTNDGDFSHQLMSPTHHVKKVYLVTYDKTLPNHAKELLSQEIALKDGTVFQPSILEVIDDFHAYLTIFEGKFHQVKRLIHYVGSNVTGLKRIKIGNLDLPTNLEVGSYLELQKSDLSKLLEK